jgi:hypothetical protein
MVSQLLASPQFAAFVTGLVLAVLWSAVGRAGRFLEAEGAARGIVALIVLGKKLEAIGYDGDKLAGKPGAPEFDPPTSAINTSITVNPPSAQAINDAITKALADALAKAGK